MGLFDVFKKKNIQPPPAKENILEEYLRRAATEPASRPEFYKKLLSENVIVLTDKTGPSGKGEHILQENTSVNIRKLPNDQIPVFTSTPKIFDKGIIKEEVSYMAMTGEALFNLAIGATFILNPYSDYGKLLLPDEVESLLNGTILSNNYHKEIIVEKDTPVQVGQPSKYPVEIVKSLKALFADRPVVKAAYLGWIFDPVSGEPPHLIFALDIEGDRQPVTNEAGFTARQLSQPGEIIDIIQIDQDSGMSSYFLNQTTPFYTR
ncbi:MAG: enhanced serine sensitivity protein SseB C-terminal domain-containing protein [Ferruginibacter sp.]